MVAPVLIKAFEFAYIGANTNTKIRRCPFGEVKVDGREGEHLKLVLYFPVILSVVELCAEATHKFPVVKEPVYENAVLLDNGGSLNFTLGGLGFFDDSDGLIVLRAFDFLRKGGSNHAYCSKSKN